MCRYAMVAYKPHYACFDCQKTFKRRLWLDIRKGEKIESEAKCPQCGSLMANMGKDFEAPKKGDNKAWQHIKDLYEVGITYHSCGCSGPGYIPKDLEILLDYFEKIKKNYLSELVFWRTRIEPETKIEKIKDEQRNWKQYTDVKPNRKKERVTNQEGIDFWIKRVQEIEEKIKITNSKLLQKQKRL